MDMRERRDAVLTGRTRAASDLERQVTLETMDDLWSDYLAAITELRAGTPWLSLGGKDPHRTFLSEVHTMFGQMTMSIVEEVQERLAQGGPGDAASRQRGATWTYLTTDEPFVPMTQRIMRGLVRMIRKGLS